jgi:hypothetical protein
VLLENGDNTVMNKTAQAAEQRVKNYAHLLDLPRAASQFHESLLKIQAHEFAANTID